MSAWVLAHVGIVLVFVAGVGLGARLGYHRAQREMADLALEEPTVNVHFHWPEDPGEVDLAQAAARLAASIRERGGLG